MIVKFKVGDLVNIIAITPNASYRRGGIPTRVLVEKASNNPYTIRKRVGRNELLGLGYFLEEDVDNWFWLPNLLELAFPSREPDWRI